MTYIRRYVFAAIAGILLTGFVFMGRPVSAAATSGEFSIQVSPSPLVSTVKPGESTTLELKIHNASSQAEDLKIVPRAFKIDTKSQDLQLVEDQVPEIAAWATFSAPSFSVLPGQTATEKITLAVPKEAGFSYAFALVISRANTTQEASGRTIKASVAVFTLINVDRPGAVRSLEVSRFAAKQGLYEYLPAEFEIDFKNTGNTIVQPMGNVFIQRGSNDATPIDTLSVNKAGGYILPGMTRTVTVTWDDGFPVHVKQPQADGSTKDELTWDWNRVSHIRFGQYTAKLVAIYDDGHRDVPLQAELTFWVVPWLMILILLAIVAVIALGIWSVIRSTMNMSKNFGRKRMKL